MQGGGDQVARQRWAEMFGVAMPKPLPEDKQLFTVKEAAPYFDLHEETLRDKIRQGKIKVIQHSPRKTYIPKSEILRWWSR